MVDRTVVLIKPDGMEKKVVGKLIDRFERAGLAIVGLKMLRLTREILEVWYAHHKDKPFFSDLVGQMTATPVIAFVLEGEGAIAKVFDICGPTDPKEAKPGTIRRDFGIDKPRNVVHRSDSSETAEKEIKLLFTPEELFK
jgi:nucleoside-diphosphate kinase